MTAARSWRNQGAHMAASRKTNLRIVIIAAATLAFLGITASGLLRPVTDAITGGLLKVAGPVYAAGVQARKAVSGASAASGGAVADEGLLMAMEELKIENAKLRALVAENESLKAALRFSERYRDAAVVARVVSESNDDALRALVIDRGSDDGLSEGQPVVVGDGILIGKLHDVHRRTSTVLLLSDSKSRLAVAIQNADDTIGVLEGDRGLSMWIGLIPQNAVLSPGDIVVTSGVEPGIRRGLAVGAIAKVSKNTQDPFQSADVQPFFSAIHPIFVQVLVPDGL